ncbi:MAG: 30S ribosome-binding factor RbfA [Bryobacteraceae bacterium]|nr:30S ribosome-binding factor RbfA [Bryobacteraceae bacterium]
MDERRSKRVSEALREELSELIGYEMTDPRVSGVDVTEVHIAPDLRIASVRVSLPPDTAARRSALEALEHAKGFLRREVGRRLQLFRVPDFRFEADTDLAGSPDRVQQLLKRIRKGRPKDD